MAKDNITRVWLPGKFKGSGTNIINFYSAYLVAPAILGATPMFGFTQRDGTSCFFWKLSDKEFLVTYEDYNLMEKVNDDYMRIPFTAEELKKIKKVNVVSKDKLKEVKDKFGWYEDKDLGKCINLYALYGKAYDGYYCTELPQKYFDLIKISDLKYYLKEED